MRRNVLKALLGLSVAAVLSMSSMAVLAAEETTEAVSEEVSEAVIEEGTEAVSEAETETETACALVLPEFYIVSGDMELEVANESGCALIEEVKFEDLTTEEDAEAGKLLGTLTLIEDDGTEHLYEEVELSDMNNPVLVEEDGFLFLNYENADGEEKTLAETAEEIAFEEPVTMYVVNDVYIRAEANSDSEALGVASLGKEYTVVAATPKWYKIETEDLTGYVARSYLSKDKESADAAVKAEEAAIAQAQAAAAAAAAAQSQSSQSSSQGVYEVSREKFDDCDGSGHGYYEITYSDGTTAIETY